MIIDELKNKNAQLIQGLKNEMAGVRTNRPNAGLIENIKVTYYEKQTPLKQLGSISISPPRDLVVQIWDASAIPGAAKAIESANLGLSTNIDGNLIRVHLPELSTERRTELIKYIKKVVEDHKIQLRHIRDQVNKQVQKDFDEGGMSEDQKFKSKEQIQNEIDKTNGEFERMLEIKTKEINE